MHVYRSQTLMTKPGNQVVLKADFFTLRFRSTGNIFTSPFSKHCLRCALMFHLSKKNSSGFSPRASAVAKAIANSPQSYEPDWIGTSMNSRTSSGFSVASTAAICAFSPSTRVQAIIDTYSWVRCPNGGNCNPVPLSSVQNLNKLAWLDGKGHCQATANWL